MSACIHGAKGYAIARLQRDKRRQQILDVALELFSKRSYDGTTAREIAEAAGMSKANLYHHFPSKDDLLYELVNPLLEELTQMLDRKPSTSHEFCERSAMLAEYLDICLAHRGVASFVYNNASLFSHRRIGSDMSDLHRRMLDFLAGGSVSVEQRVRAAAALAVLRSAVLEFSDYDSSDYNGAAVREAALTASTEVLDKR